MSQFRSPHPGAEIVEKIFEAFENQQEYTWWDRFKDRMLIVIVVLFVVQFILFYVLGVISIC